MRRRKTTQLTLPDLMLIAGTRIALGAGVALLLAGRLPENVRRGAGWALVAVGALTTIPLVAKIRGARPSEALPAATN